MNAADRDSILTRLWGYVALLPTNVAPLYAGESERSGDQTGLWVSFLGDLVDRRLDDELAQQRYLPLFADPARAPAAMSSLQAAWTHPRMDHLRELIERDVRALQSGDSTSLVPAESPSGSGREGAAMDRT